MLPQPPASPKTGVVIGIPSVGWQTTLFVKHLMTMVMPLNSVVTYKFIGTQRYGDQVRPVAEADNVIMHEARREGAKFLLFLEEDVIIPPLGLRQMLATMGRYPEATVVAGVVTSKTVPPEPMIYRGEGLGAYWDFKLGEIFPVTSVHMGCTLIRLADLDDLKVPLVEVEDYPGPGDRSAIPEFFRTAGQPESEGKSYHSQDVYFCQMIGKAGKKVYVDANVNCGHYDFKRSLMYGLPSGGPPRETTAEAVNLGCGLDWDFIDGIKPLRVDINEVNHPDFRADLRALPASWTGRFDIVFSSHVLEHFNRYEVPKVFAEMVRVCKSGGEIRLALPSIEWAIEEWIKNKGQLNGRIIDVIWGGRSVPAVGSYPQMYHKMGIGRTVVNQMAQGHQLVGRSQRTGYNDVHRLFKAPVRADVLEWAKGQGDFNQRFVDTEAPVATGTGDDVLALTEAMIAPVLPLKDGGGHPSAEYPPKNGRKKRPQAVASVT